MTRVLWSLALFVPLAGATSGQEPMANLAGLKFFETHVRPVLSNRCYECHGPEKQKGKLRVDSLAALLAGGKSGPALKAGKPDESLLIQAIRHGESLQMPPRMKLPAKEIGDLTAWVKMGAPWPDAKTQVAKQPAPEGETIFTKAQTAHWAFQPIRKPDPPAVRNPGWGRSPLDAFILAKLQEKGLAPAPAADARTLIRRLTFDLIGLPPTPAEVEAFVAESRAAPQAALEKAVDRLLASPRYGERWARHWLDVVRYADSNGMDENLVFGNAWRYRDYVIKAFNTDKPYDEFVREQIAGDLPPAKNPDEAGERIIATGFLCIGPKMLAEDDPVKMEMDIIDEQVDTMGRAFMGMTLGCVRCHDHKYDPFTIADYYALAGIFKSTKTMDNFRVVARWQERPTATLAEVQKASQHAKKMAELQENIARAIKQQYGAIVQPERQRAREYWETARAVHLMAAGKTVEQWARDKRLKQAFLKQWLELARKSPVELNAVALAKVSLDEKGPFRFTAELEADFSAAARKELGVRRSELAAMEKSAPVLAETMAVSEGKATNLRIHLRGNHMTQGREVPRRFPKLFSNLKQEPIDASQSGRLSLARWMTLAEHPLTSRVMVNRLWHWHFGSGLVRSVDNFGLLGEKPSHPELLDWLATRFIESGWSIKAMQRIMVLSSAYQMSGAYHDGAYQIDPDNRLHWRHNRRRLEAEALRDSLYGLGGNLDVAMGGTLFDAKNRKYVPGYPNGNYEKYDFPRRSIYLPVIRSAQYEVLQAFDFADPSFPSGERAITTVAPQALFLMNGKIVHEQTRAWAEKLLLDSKLDDAGRVGRIYEQALGRPARAQEIERALDFLQRIESERARQKMVDSRAHAWQSLCRVMVSANEFVYVE